MSVRRDSNESVSQRSYEEENMRVAGWSNGSAVGSDTDKSGRSSLDEGSVNGSTSQFSVDCDMSASLARLVSDKSDASASLDASYSGEWDKLFTSPRYLDSLKQLGVDGHLRSSRFRSLSWKLYLQVLPEDKVDWVARTRHWRNTYKELKQTLIVNPRKGINHSDLSVNNPLSQENESPWNQFFQDNELRVTIKQDVIRTFPEIEFYQDSMWHSIMVNILFCCAKQFKRLSYRQGMHELLAPLIFVLHCDHQAYLHACESESIRFTPTPQRDILEEVMDPEFIEHDAYAMFYQIMETVEPWYVSKEISPIIKMNSILSAQPFTKFQDLHPSNVIITKLTRIQDYLLKKVDPELHEHLTTMDIPPQIYGIRWVRLLFGREFPMQDLLMLWDAIFADGISFDLVDYIFVAMLLYIRDAMIMSDYPSCLQLLMKYPQVGDVHYFVTKAMYLREPSESPVPPVYSFQKPPTPLEEGAPATNKGGKRNMMSGLFSRKSTNGRPRTLGVTENNSTVSRSTSEPMNLITDTDQSPVVRIPRSGKRRKGSSASLSNLETVRPYQATEMHTASSAQSLAKLETASARSETAATPTRTESIRAETASLPSRRFSSLPRGSSKKGKRAQERNLEYDLAIMMARLNDMETMCRKCSDCMDTHIYKLQSELMTQNVDNEDELLLSLAGLKQVRDVLRGTLKPSSLFDTEEIRIRDNHYKEDSPPARPPGVSGSLQSSVTATPSQDSCEGNVMDKFYVATPDLLSDTDLQSPDNDYTNQMIDGNDDPMMMSVTTEPSPIRSLIRNPSSDSNSPGSGMRGDYMPRDFVPTTRKPSQSKPVEMSDRHRAGQGPKSRASSNDSYHPTSPKDDVTSYPDLIDIPQPAPTTEELIRQQEEVCANNLSDNSSEYQEKICMISSLNDNSLNSPAPARTAHFKTNVPIEQHRARDPSPMNKLVELFKGFPKF